MDGTEDLGTSILTIRYKIVFVGDVAVGKTSVMNRFVNNDFSDKYDVMTLIENFCFNIKVAHYRS